MRPLTRIISILAVIFGVIGIFALKLVIDAGAFKKIAPHFAGTCEKIDGVYGAEDIEPVPGWHSVVVSADHRPESEGSSSPSGTLFLWDYETPGAKPIQLIATDANGNTPLGFDFHPHGISVRGSPLGARIWVINHRINHGANSASEHGSIETTVEVFGLDMSAKEPKLIHLKSLHDPLLANANDLAAVDSDRFYVTSDHSGKTELTRKLEDYTRIGRGYVSFYDGTRFMKKATSIRFANGIQYREAPSGFTNPAANTGQSGPELVVAAMLGRELQVYGVDGEMNLHLKSKIPLATAPDNLNFDTHGDIWIGAHPNLFKLKAISRNHAKLAPAQILRVHEPSTDHPRVEEVYLDSGEKISASSVAYHSGKHLILGSIYGRWILSCELP